MRKVCLTVIGICVLFLHAFSQFMPVSPDSTGYKTKPLKIDEVELVSSYYSQDGDHSAVTGGIGTEKVTDLSNGLDLKLVGYNAKQRKNTLTFGLGIDHHSSASSAYVNKTGASKTGGSRIYPSVHWDVENEQKGSGFGMGLYYSSEYNYKSFGLDAGYSKKTKNNGEFSGKLNAYFDKVKLIYPSELIPSSTTVITSASSGGGEGENYIPSSPRTTLSGSFSFSQVINTRLQASLLLDLVYQSGYLGLPFHRVYFSNGSEAVENLPAERLKLPLGLRVNYFLGDNIILRSYYRYYIDDWGMQSHTASLEVPVKITPFFSISPFYRYYRQTAAQYFAPYMTHAATDAFYTSNYAYSALTSHFMGAGLRLAPPGGILHTDLHSLEIRYGHYTQSTDLVSNVISIDLDFK